MVIANFLIKLASIGLMFYIIRLFRTSGCRIILGIYIGLVIYLTLFSRNTTEHQISFMPKVWKMFSVSWAGHGQYIFVELINNVLLFIPFGYLLRSSFVSIKNWQVVLLGFFFSLCIELLQYLFSVGVSEIDDLINNTLGTIVGCLYWKLMCKLQKT